MKERVLERERGRGEGEGGGGEERKEKGGEAKRGGQEGRGDEVCLTQPQRIIS